MKSFILPLALTFAMAGPALAAEKATGASQPAGATIMSYKRDPVPIFDDTGSKVRDIAKAEMPKANSAASKVVNAKPGFVAILLDGKPAWVRLSSVDYVGDLPAPPCEKKLVQVAALEEDGVERSLGLGCSKGK